LEKENDFKDTNSFQSTERFEISEINIEMRKKAKEEITEKHEDSKRAATEDEKDSNCFEEAKTAKQEKEGFVSIEESCNFSSESDLPMKNIDNVYELICNSLIKPPMKKYLEDKELNSMNDEGKEEDNKELVKKIMEERITDPNEEESIQTPKTNPPNLPLCFQNSQRTPQILLQSDKKPEEHQKKCILNSEEAEIKQEKHEVFYGIDI
jgi:hypothetical protein